MSVPDGPLNIDHWKDEADEVRRKRDWWWKVLAKLRKEYSPIFPAPARGNTEFNDWLIENYGVSMIHDHAGQILGDYNIVDEKKHLVLLLKFA